MIDATAVVRVKRTDIVTYSCDVSFGDLVERLHVHPDIPLQDLLALITAHECDMSPLNEYLEHNQHVKVESSTWLATSATAQTAPLPSLALLMAAQALDRLLTLRTLCLNTPDHDGVEPAGNSEGARLASWRAADYFDWLTKILDDLAASCSTIRPESIGMPQSRQNMS